MVGLPCDLQYCFDSMMELHEITGDVYEFYFSVKENAINFLDNNSCDPQFLKNDYANWRKNADPITKAYLTVCGITSLKYQKNDFILGVTNESIRLAKGKPSKTFIEKVLKSDIACDSIGRFIVNAETLFQNAKVDFKNISISEVEKFALKKKNEIDAYRGLEFSAIDAIRNTKEYKTRSKEKEKMLKKSVSLMTNFFPPEDTKLFLGKNYITISGINFDFKIKPKSMTNLAHGALDIQVYNKENKNLGSLCFYYEGMPAADQVTAFLLDVRVGNENEILKVGNLARTKEADECAILNEIKPKVVLTHDGEDIGMLMDNALERQMPGHKLMRKYHDQVKPITNEVVNKVFKTKFKLLDSISTKFIPENSPLLLT